MQYVSPYCGYHERACVAVHTGSFPSAASPNLVMEPAVDEPPKGTPEWEQFHSQSRLKKHEANKKRRQLEKAAIGFTIASSKVGPRPSRGEITYK